MVAASTLAKAESTGAKTVKSPLLRVLTRFTPGLTWPETALVRVVSSGLFEAAVATGSFAIPPTEPDPLGTWAAEVLLVAVVEVEPQAARVRARAPPATSRSARFINICCSLGGRLRDSEPCRVSLWLMGDYSDPVRSDSLRCH